MIMLRLATQDDVDALLQIDAQSHHATWTAAHFQTACTSEHDTVLLLENDTEVMAFIVWQRVLDEMELHLIATAPAYRQQGHASTLMREMLQAACTHATQRILLEVRANNVNAQALYAKHGFQPIARRKNYYDGTEDAIIMAYESPEKTKC